MKINRRDLLFASGLSLLAGTRATGQGAAPPRAQSQTPRSPSARLLEALQGNRLPLTMSRVPWDAAGIGLSRKRGTPASHWSAKSMESRKPPSSQRRRRRSNRCRNRVNVATFAGLFAHRRYARKRRTGSTHVPLGEELYRTVFELNAH